MSKAKTISIKEDIISPKGAIIIPKGKLLKLDLTTIDRLKSHGVYYEVLESKNNSSQHEQTKNSFSNEISIKEYMLSGNDNHISLNMLNNNNSKKYRIISDLMNEFVFDGRNEEWYLY